MATVPLVVRGRTKMVHKKRRIHPINPNKKNKKGAMPNSMIEPAETVAFADENAQIAWEVAAAIERIAPTLPMEGSARNRISFTPEHEVAGSYALLIGSMLDAAEDDENVLLVSDRGLQLLQELHIPYQSRLA